jgi:hypothetical protein
VPSRNIALPTTKLAIWLSGVWNAVTRPYGMDPGSTVRVVDTCGLEVGATVYFCMRIEQFRFREKDHRFAWVCWSPVVADVQCAILGTATGDHLVRCLQDCGSPMHD